jgi:hypothetical protein
MLGIDLPYGDQYLMGVTSPPLPCNIGLVLGDDKEMSSQGNIRFHGNEVPKVEESHIEYCKSLTVEALKQA